MVYDKLLSWTNNANNITGQDIQMSNDLFDTHMHAGATISFIHARDRTP